MTNPVMRKDARNMLRCLLHAREPEVGMEVGIQDQEIGCNICWLGASRSGEEREVPEPSTPTSTYIIYGVLTILQAAH